MLKRRDFKVYRFKTINKTIIYVGITGKMTIERFMEHAKDKYWINEVAEVEDCIVEDEAQARTNETIYINLLKPIFNAKDKFSGTVRNTLRPKDKKFSHAFYVLNGEPTTCVPQFKEDYTLINFIEYDEQHIGMYYDCTLGLYFSATDVCNVLGITPQKLRKTAENNPEYVKVSYDTISKGTEKEKTAYLCSYRGIYELIAKETDNAKAEECRALLKEHYNISDIKAIYGDDYIAECAKYSFLDELEHLTGDRFNQSHVKRRLVYRAMIDGEQVIDVVYQYNESMAVYDAKFPVERMAADIFSMIEDLDIEYGSSYKDVITGFSKYLQSNYGINFWKVREKITKQLRDNYIQSHFVIALEQSTLYKPFEEFYNELI